MENQSPSYQVEDNETSFKEFIIKIQNIWRELWKNWWVILIFSIPFVAYNIYKYFNTEPMFTAEVKYIVEGEGGSSFGGLGGLLGQFGFGRGGGGKSNPFQIIEVAKSKRIVGEMLFSKSTKTGNYLANQIIEIYKLDEAWEKSNPQLVGFRFKSDAWEDFNEVESMAFNRVYRKVIGSSKDKIKPLLKISFEEEKGIYIVRAQTESEDLSLETVHFIYKSVKYFFEEKVLEEKVVSRDLLKTKSDSIKSLINYKALQLARFEDQNRGLISNEKRIRKEQLSVEISGLTAAFSESIKNFEIADYTLKQSKPIFLQFDKPMPPLEPEKDSLLISIVMALFLGGIIGSIYIIGRMIFKEAMAK